ncbi:hypothetical protein EDM36_10305 [Staphylococcus aureus]|nr:hypothetical protein EDM44_07805 [Staphylococcus aureus]RNB11289.1 hypothetical protein EDM41_08105 [Staphylococcus aureus]RNB15653.1 hypothetical protein EDM39_09235 [Staphylococcus aureus]RNB18107.1 hypothetical protein EDM36_10305 [Staphylococcus aureus]
MPDLIEMIVFKVFTSWRGPNTEADEKSAYNNVQVGGPQHREFQKKFYRQCKLGINEINFVKRLFLSHSQKSLHNKSLRAL